MRSVIEDYENKCFGFCREVISDYEEAPHAKN
jgi:hypothetical protein